ncbi:MAG: hypothetical protein J0L66_10680 [Cytophagales bacterium]|nr:hypothetical protein [Cytophagales bacterium]
MTRKTTLIVLTILFFTSAYGQDEAEISKVIENIERVFHSQSGQLILDLRQIPESIIKRIEFIHDSIETATYNSYSKAKQEAFNRFNAGVKSDKLIANKSDKWRAGDVIHEGNQNLPTRKFFMAILEGSEMVFAYWHGGIGVHLHMYYIQLDNVERLTGFVTIKNSETFYKHERKNKLDKIRTAELTKLVDIDDLRVFKGKVIYPLDVI